MLLCLGPEISKNALRLLHTVLVAAITDVETSMVQNPERSVILWRSWDKVRGDWLLHVHIYTWKRNLGKCLHLARILLETEENVCANKWSHVRVAEFWKILPVNVVGKIVCFTSLRQVNTHFFRDLLNMYSVTRLRSGDGPSSSRVLWTLTPRGVQRASRVLLAS